MALPAPLSKFMLILVVLVVGGIFASVTAAFVVLIVVPIGNELILVWRKNRYFATEEFQGLRAQTAELVAEHNAVVDYVTEIHADGAFDVGASASGRHAHLATFQNKSAWKYQRDRNVAEYAPHVHNASLQVVRNASSNPLKYVMKYFSIKADRETCALEKAAERGSTNSNGAAGFLPF